MDNSSTSFCNINCDTVNKSGLMIISGKWNNMFSCGEKHLMCLSGDGLVYSFGSSNQGLLGRNIYFNDEHVPEHITSLPIITYIACGEAFTMCVDYNGVVWAFGWNDCLQLGFPTAGRVQIEPKIVEGLPPIKQVKCGDVHTICLAEDGSIWGFGANAWGQLGLGYEASSSTMPTKIPNLTDIESIACGNGHTLVCTNKGDLFSFGRNDLGQLGLGTTNSESSPQPIRSLAAQVQAISASFQHSMILTIDGRVFTFGDNYRGQLGRKTNGNCVTAPMYIEGIPAMRSISAAYSYSMCISEDGYLWIFSDKSVGLETVPNRDAASENSYAKVLHPKNIVSMSEGGRFSVVQDSTGNLFKFGVTYTTAKQLPTEFSDKILRVHSRGKSANK